MNRACAQLSYKEEVGSRQSAPESGFTFIELAIVALVIVILAAVALPLFLQQRDEARRLYQQQDTSYCQQAAAHGETPPESCAR